MTFESTAFNVNRPRCGYQPFGERSPIDSGSRPPASWTVPYLFGLDDEGPVTLSVPGDPHVVCPSTAEQRDEGLTGTRRVHEGRFVATRAGDLQVELLVALGSHDDHSPFATDEVEVENGRYPIAPDRPAARDDLLTFDGLQRGGQFGAT